MHAAPNHKFGLALVFCSVLLVSAAQLLLKRAIDHNEGFNAVAALLLNPHWHSLWPLVSGLSCYAISVVVWQRALGELPLSIAYPLLGLSYPLVYIAALWLPGYDESINPQRIAGLILVLAGTALLAPRRSPLNASR